MLIHTFEAKVQVKKELYHAIAKELCGRSDWMRNGKEIIYFGYRFCGILVKLIMTGKEDYVRYDVVYRISPCRLFDPDDYLGLFDTAFTDKMIDELNFRLRVLCPLLPDADMCELSRVDFTVNAVMENRKQVKAYLDFIDRCRLPKHMKPKTRYDKVGKRHKKLADGFTVGTDKDKHNVEISIYDKYRQMEKENEKSRDPVFSERALTDGENILRLEVRLMKHKVYALEKKYGVYSVRSFLKNADVIAPKIVEDYLTRMIPRETVRTLVGARKIIAESALDDEKKARLTAFVETVSVKRSTQKAIDAYKADGKQSEAKKCLKMLEKLNINCVVAKEKTMKIFEGYVPTPTELWDKALSEYDGFKNVYVLRIGKRRKKKNGIYSLDKRAVM